MIQPSVPDPSGVIGKLLRAVRHHVGADVVYLTAYGLDGAEICAVDGEATALHLTPGTVVPLAQSACLAAASGQLPRSTADTEQDRALRRLVRQRPVPIGAFAAAPVRLSDGTLFGGLCLAHRGALPELTPATEAFLAAMADVVGAQLEDEDRVRRDSRRERDAVLALFEDDCLSTVLQPIVDVTTGRTLGVEALSRFATTPPRPPDLWFSAASRHGLGVELEAAAVRRATRVLPRLPGGWYLALNASPALVDSGVLDRLLDEHPGERLVVEVTEHAAVADYDGLRGSLNALRSRGVRVAVDDAGAGFSSLRHVVRLEPEIIKVDGSLIRDIDAQPLHRAMVESLAGFADHSGATMVAEAVETPRELATLQDLQVPAAQGYLFASPSEAGDMRASYPVAVPQAFRSLS